MGFHITLPSRFWVQLFLTNLISLKCLSSPARGRNNIFHTTFSESRQNGHSRLAFHKHDATSAAEFWLVYFWCMVCQKRGEGINESSLSFRMAIQSIISKKGIVPIT